MRPGLVVIAFHDHRLVVLSVLISILAAYAARDLSERVSEAQGRSWFAWLAGAATVDGIGIWSMHYTGKLALRLPFPQQFDWPAVLLSLLVGIVGSAAALVVITRSRAGWPQALAASIFMGALGISGMHYAAMAALRIPATQLYSPPLVTASIIVAVVLSFIALWLNFLVRDADASRPWRNHASSVLRGAANPAMHYTAMAAVTFVYSSELPDLSHAVSISSLGILGISIVPVMVLTVALLTSLVDRLRKQRVLLDELFEQAPQAVSLTDADNRVVRVNREFTRLFGYTPQEAVGRRLTDLIVPEESQEEAQRFTDMVARGQRVEAEVVRRRKDGSRLDVSVIRVPVFVPGGRIAVYAIFRDITERKLLENDLRQAQKMEAVGQLAGGIAHDFNNVLTVINGYCTLMLERQSIDDEMRAELLQILEAGERAALLTQRLLAFSRRQLLQTRVVDLNTIVAQIQPMLRRLIPEDIEIAVSLSPETGAVKADPPQLEQVIINLAVNARDAMPQGGKLMIQTSVVELDESYARSHPEVTPGRYALLAVSDTGAGMAEATKARIFEPFFTTKEVGKGTGLGLAIVYGVVRQIGGHISVYSEPGVGTTLKIYLPSVAETAEVAPAATARPEEGGTETIFLAEDDDAVRAFAARILTARGYVVIPVASGPEALAASASYDKPIDLLVTDVVMPGMSGRNLADQLKRQRPRMRVLFISGYAGDAIAQHGVLDTAIAFLAKPFSPEALAQNVREALDREEPGSG